MSKPPETTINIRGVPTDLWHEARRAAIAEGVTLKAWVIAALRKALQDADAAR